MRWLIQWNWEGERVRKKAWELHLPQTPNSSKTHSKQPLAAQEVKIMKYALFALSKTVELKQGVEVKQMCEPFC